jgi:hypothetical protein
MVWLSSRHAGDKIRPHILREAAISAIHNAAQVTTLRFNDMMGRNRHQIGYKNSKCYLGT